MAETIHVAEMADRLSKELFGQFFWQKCGPTNQNWACNSPETHGVKTHPADIVYFYDEPYQQTRTYVHCDLKSYAKSSISSKGIASALGSLAKQIECAERSEEWQNLYALPTVDFRVVGLLFIYNHDVDFDPDFERKIQSIDIKKLNIAPSLKLYVLGPDDIYWINNVSNDLRGLRGDGHIPSPSNCRFFFPQLIRKTNFRLHAAKAATLDMLSSPWIVLEYDRDDGGRGIVIYYRRPVREPRELVYLIDYLRHFQLLLPDVTITIRVLADNKTAFENFSKAKLIYIGDVIRPSPQRVAGGDVNIVDLINRIEMSSIQNVARTFSLKELASRDS
ncbi:hypothetical protein [Xanthobacter versatilis]|uniref:hypothetical protein n=1 Tax=Xanthobacter autotrophicus (strain ATCC BAA-1158 / Py2) TaxID=78245 RepID=UPI003726C58F